MKQDVFNKPTIVYSLICAATIAFTLSINVAITDYLYIRTLCFISLLCLFYIYPFKFFFKKKKQNKLINNKDYNQDYNDPEY